ncbi:MAG: hypothetical protein DRN57_02275 [Thermoplasmata archaeon]|nr:MAG: hypothetical protein DRN57_02275 [Thermoplasmata archaeon]
MTSNDIMLRGGMIMAVLILVSIAASHLAQHTEDAALNGFRETADSLGKALESISRCGPGSTTHISLGEPGSGTGSDLIIPASIGNNEIRIRVLPGSVFLEMEGERETVIQSDDILPMFPPCGEADMGDDDIRAASFAAAGFTLKAPACLTVSTIRTGRNVSVFLYPLIRNDPGPEGPVSWLIELSEVSIVDAASESRVRFAVDDMMIYAGGGLFLWECEEYPIEDGTCPVPFKSGTPAVIVGGEERKGKVTGMDVESCLERTDSGLFLPVWKVNMKAD